MRRKEKKAPSLILYEKYKYEHHLGEVNDKPAETKPSVMRRVGNLLICVILTGMIILSAIGTIALVHPQMRMLLMNIFDK